MLSSIDQMMVRNEFPLDEEGHVYLNSGCCGRKPLSVMDAMARAYEKLNTNPCHFTFNDSSPVDQARAAVARLLDVKAENILIAPSTTAALQILMQSFLLSPGDELVTTDQEHGSLRTIAQYLSETRAIVVRRYEIGTADSAEFCQGILNLVNERTKVVALSAIISYTGWRPDLTELVQILEKKGVLMIADCAHGPGQILCRPASFPMWVGSGHKWLGGPNGTAFAYVRDDLRERLKPVALGDTYYAKKDLDNADLSRLESAGTADLSRWRGLTRAIDLHFTFGVEAVMQRQIELARYLRRQLESKLAPTFRTPDMFEQAPHLCTGILNFRFAPERLKVENLQDYLWKEHKIAVQLDYLNDVPGHGMRISCHVSNSEAELDRLVAALEAVVIK